MKVALILPNNIWFCPYAKIYTRLFDLYNVKYDIISWNRDGRDPKEGFQFNLNLPKEVRSATIGEYLKFVNFVRKTIHREKYDRLVLVGPEIAILMLPFLLGWKKRYVIDYRDLSVEQKPIFKSLFYISVKRSFATVISSPGFQRCLPKHDYFISHNFDVDTVKASLKLECGTGFNTADEVDVLTIGGIRDYDSNIEVVNALANKSGIKMRFVGKGPAEEQIKEYCATQHVKNVQFSGFYQKEEEPGFINKSTFLNIFYPRVITHDTAMSNRFYNSLIYKRPMIVTKDTTQGDLADKHEVGIAVKDCVDLQKRLNDFLNKDYSQYARSCNELLKSFLKDQDDFEMMMRDFLKN